MKNRGGKKSQLIAATVHLIASVDLQGVKNPIGRLPSVDVEVT